MGRDKLLLEVGGVPLLRRVYDALSDRCAEIVVVGWGGATSRLEGVRRVPDERPRRQIARQEPSVSNDERPRDPMPS